MIPEFTGLNGLRENEEGPVKIAENIPQGLKARLMLCRLRHE